MTIYAVCPDCPEVGSCAECQTYNEKYAAEHPTDHGVWTGAFEQPPLF